MADQTQKAFSELTEQGHQLEAVLQGMDDGVLAVDQYDNILLFNERVKALLQNSGLKIGEKAGRLHRAVPARRIPQRGSRDRQRGS